MSLGPKSLVFTTARVRNGHVFHLDLHEKRLRKHGEKLGIKIPHIEVPECEDGLLRIEIKNETAHYSVKPFYQEVHMEAEGITVPAPRWTRKITGLKHGDWQPYDEITKLAFNKGADVALLVHEHCIVDGDRVMPIVLDDDGVVWVSDSIYGGVDSITFNACREAITNAGYIISKGRLNERLVARAKEIVLLGSGMGAARLTVLDDVDIGDGSNNLQKVCINALGPNWY